MRTILDRAVGWALAVCLGAMTCLVFSSVILRYVFNSPVTWSEELASLLFAWLTFVGAFVGFRTRSHIRIDTFTTLLPAVVRARIRRLADIGVLSLLLVFIWQGVSLTATTWGLEFPALEVSRGFLYVSLPIGACLMFSAVLLSWRAGAETHGDSGDRRC